MSAAGPVVREIDPASARQPILAVLGRNLPRAVRPGRHEWLYESNPCGPARVWALEDGGTVVGVSAAHPRRMRIRGAAVDALNLGDFAIDEPYRSLGPALRLLRATLEPVREGRCAVAYDHPNDRMLAVHRRLGSEVLGPMRRWVRPLSARPVLERKLGDGILGRVAGGVVDAALRVRDLRLRRARGVAVEPLEGDFGGEFDRLDESLAPPYEVRGDRSAAFLRWRYVQHPLWDHDTLCARRGGELLGYAVFRGGDHRTLLVTEFETADDPAVRRSLLAGLVDHARDRGAVALCVQLLEGSPAATLFRALGFHEREAGTSVAVASSPGVVANRPASWWMVEGDRDV